MNECFESFENRWCLGSIPGLCSISKIVSEFYTLKEKLEPFPIAYIFEKKRNIESRE